ncbi:MAG: hypothetical protein QFX34_01660 [Candidatus Verstraetearchaeota archaeon]|nr:hypothetical protein [Candidatus Verstraetearchaeota archaeon]
MSADLAVIIECVDGYCCTTEIDKRDNYWGKCMKSGNPFIYDYNTTYLCAPFG